MNRKQTSFLIPGEKIFAVHRAGGPSLPSLCRELLAQQRSSWRHLEAGCRELAEARFRDVPCAGFGVRLQFNPRRMASTAARVDPESVGHRTCFLCWENLPPGQRGILYRDKFLILCNPAPIFPQHYTISAVGHAPQEIKHHAAVLFSLAADLAGEFTVFYNGPRCGASAPDHLHFQAVPSGLLPVETYLAGGKAGPSRRLGHVALFGIEHLGRTFVVLEGNDSAGLEAVLMKLIEEMKKAAPATVSEPMMNLLCSQDTGRWRVTVFPRRKHRPDAYFCEGDRQVMVSPGAVDMGGVIVTPREKDFLALDCALVQGIFREVSMDGETLAGILSALE